MTFSFDAFQDPFPLLIYFLLFRLLSESFWYPAIGQVK
jgi:hypothetical protein